MNKILFLIRKPQRNVLLFWPRPQFQNPKAIFGKLIPHVDLNILIINFQSLWNKRVELCNLANDLRPDIIIGNVTWLTPEINNAEIGLNDYDIFRRDREGKKGGGF